MLTADTANGPIHSGCGACYATKLRNESASAGSANLGLTMLDPFFVEAPACISFSGGRTSGYMLWRILQANGGKLPEGVVVLFANTGKEMPETLDFVKACGDHWNVPIVWLEYVPTHSFAVVDYASAARNGEPFMALIEHRKMLPNPISRFCTVELKVRTMHRYLKSIGIDEWDSYVGIRADEPYRVAKLTRQDYGKQESKVAPLAEVGVTSTDVAEFWRGQEFDLGLPNINGKSPHGNCDLCFLKAADQNLSLIRESPSRADWWIAAESRAAELGAGQGSRFRIDRPSYAAMRTISESFDDMFQYDDALQDCACTD